MQRRNVVLTASAGAAAGVLGLVTLGLPANAGGAPSLPPIAPDALVQSVMTAPHPALSGTVRADNALGLPPLPDAGQLSGLLSNGTSQFEVWSDGQGRERLSVPSRGGELTVVNDGTTVWQWDSVKHTATESRHPAAKPDAKPATPADPASAARQIIDTVGQTSSISVSGTGSVAGRDAYELVLTPKPTERTLLRQVRIAVDAQKRIPLEVEVDTNGSSDPALKVGFAQIDMTAPDADLFQFTPPAGSTVIQDNPPSQPLQKQRSDSHVVGQGWDSVLVTRLSQQSTGHSSGRNGNSTDLRALASRIGQPVNGPWGNGWLISSRALTALVTSDGRLAVGPVPAQVLTDALDAAR